MHRNMTLIHKQDDFGAKISMLFGGIETMRLLVLLMLLFGTTLILLGCASTSHYYKADNDKVHIYLTNPDAQKVLFLSSVDQFQHHEALKNNKGIWEITVPSGQEMKYFYIIDGKVFTPECDQTDKDDLGGRNCIYVPGQ